MGGAKDAGRALVALLLPLACGCAMGSPRDDSGKPGCSGAREPLRCTGPLTFALATPYHALSGPDGFVIADLNGDGKPDLVVPTHVHTLVSPGEIGHILVLLNQGDGTFVAGARYKIPHDPTVGVGDLDGDGDPEIVVSDSESSTVTVLRNDGRGTFTVAAPIHVNPGPRAVSVGDVNGDGKADVYWFEGDHLRALINQGRGTFTGAPVSSGSFAGDVLVAGDLNGDGAIDVVAAEDEDVRVYLNAGDGTFLPPAVYPSLAPVSQLSLVSWRGAGPTDILVAGTVDTVLLDSGRGTFPTHVAIPSPPPFTAVGDMNGDGKADLIGVHPGDSAVDVWLNGGDDTFSTRVSMPITRYGVTAQVSDLNGDGLLDIVTLSQPSANQGMLDVLLNACQEPAAPHGR